MKRILILTAGFGEGHNSAARGVRDALARVGTDQVQVEMRDLFPETYGGFNDLVRRTYLAVINQWPRSWGYMYDWLDGIRNFDQRFARFSRLKAHLARLLEQFKPDIVVSTFPPYPYLLRQIQGIYHRSKSVVVITDALTVNAIWYQCPADYFFPPNEQSADVLRRARVPDSKIKVVGFPVSPKFADLAEAPSLRADAQRVRIAYVINAAKRRAPELVRKLTELDVDLTVTVGSDERLRRRVEKAIGNGKLDIVGWTDEMPRLLCRSHILIGKAGGATVQETIAAGCPMIVNHVVSGQEEGNARLIAQTKSGTIAVEPDEVVDQIRRAFANGGELWQQWAGNIARLSRPRAALDLAEFLLSI